jgi:hypothetical protein
MEVATRFLKIVWIPELLSISLNAIQINNEKLYIFFSDPARDFLKQFVDLFMYRIGLVPISLG